MVKMDKIIQELAVEETRIDIIQQELASINSKLDNLIETVTNNHLDHLDRYNRLSERITILEAEKNQTRYLLGFSVVILAALEFTLKYIL